MGLFANILGLWFASMVTNIDSIGVRHVEPTALVQTQETQLSQQPDSGQQLLGTRPVDGRVVALEGR